MVVRRKYFYPVAFAAMLFSSSAFAKLHPTYFKDVTKNFKATQEFFSPTLGEAALSGLIENIRFFGSFKAAFNKNGERDYMKDSSSDPLWNIVKRLFPSSNGQLGTVVNAKNNFAKHVLNPKTVALLLNYAKEAEDIKANGNLSKGVIEKYSEDIFETLAGVEIDKKNFKLNVITPLLKDIEKSIKLEKAGKSLYPRHTTEQAISAFFAYQFNTQEDIWEMIRGLDNTIVDEDQVKLLPVSENLLTENDIPEIAAKAVYNIDDIFAISNAELWKSLTPYKAGISLLNNGSSLFYDRQENKYIEGKTFPDCVETAGRHIDNLFLFNPETKEFNLDAARSYTKEHSPDNPYFKNVELFYEKQTPLLANAGDIGIRSLNNQIVADLNQPEDPIKITYVKDNNELRSGFVNFIRVRQKIYGLNLAEFPATGLEDKNTWVNESLKTWFGALNPTYEFDIQLKLEETEDDLSGDAGIVVKMKGTGEDLFSFNIMSSRIRNHTEINRFKILRASQLGEVNYASMLKNHENTLHQGTAEDSLWLLDEVTAKEKANHPLYQLFSTPLNDNASKIEFLKKLKDHYKEWTQLHTQLPSLQNMIKNVMNSISWEDFEIVNQISPVILTMIDEPELQAPLFESVKALKIEGLKFKEVEQILQKFKVLEFLSLTLTEEQGELSFAQPLGNLKKLYFDSYKITALKIPQALQLQFLKVSGDKKFKKVVLTQPLEELKTIDFAYSDIETVEGLENAPNLESLNLSGTTQLAQFSLINLFEKLKTIDFQRSGIQALEGLENAPNLESIDLGSTTQLTQFSLTNLFEKLKTINLQRSKIQALEGLENAPNLESVDLSNTHSLRKFLLTKTLEKLKTINLQGAGIQALEGLENAPNLESLDLSYSYLSKFLLTKPLEKLKTINLKGAEIETVEGLENVPNLESLNLASVKKLTSFLITKPLEKLKTIDLAYSDIKTLGGLENAPNLESLNLDSVKKLTSFLITEPLEKLKTINLAYSDIETLEGLENVPNLENLNLESTEYLAKVSITKPLERLKTIGLEGTGIETFEGLENATNLEELNLSYISYLPKFSLTKPLEKLKTIDLRGSGIEKLKEIEKNAPNLEELNLSYTKQIKEIDFTATLKKLRSFSIKESTISKLSGLGDLENLRNLDLEGSQSITHLKFEKDNKDLVLNLRGSGIKSRDDIDGFDYLDPSKVFF